MYKVSVLISVSRYIYAHTYTYIGCRTSLADFLTRCC